MRNNFLITFWERFKIPDRDWIRLRSRTLITHWRYAEHRFIRGSFSGVLLCHTCKERGSVYIFPARKLLLYLAPITSLVLKRSGGVSVCLLRLRPLPGLGRRGRGTNLGTRDFLWFGQRRRWQLLTGVEVGDVTFRDRVQAGAGAVGRVQSGCGVQGRTGTGRLLEI